MARAITAKLIEHDTDHVWLDATGLERFDERFPTIAAELRTAGLDPATDWLPIAPAAHYHCGGVLTDLRGATALPGLWAAGEVAGTGVHGANRLASNSLLEGMVFGPRVIEAIGQGIDGPEPTGAMRAVLDGTAPADAIGGRRISVPDPTPAAPAAGRHRRAAGRAAAHDDALRRRAALGRRRSTRPAPPSTPCGAGAAGDPMSPAAYELVNLVDRGRRAAHRGPGARGEPRLPHPPGLPRHERRLPHPARVVGRAVRCRRWPRARPRCAARPTAWCRRSGG